jgi:hypothetical protein
LDSMSRNETNICIINLGIALDLPSFKPWILEPIQSMPCFAIVICRPVNRVKQCIHSDFRISNYKTKPVVSVCKYVTTNM